MYCCFTGHRPENLKILFNKNSAEYLALKKALADITDIAINDGYLDFFFGMARGIDTMAAEILIEKAAQNSAIKLHAVIPCPNQDESWNEEDKMSFRKILSHCDTKTVISPFFTPECMLERNRYMVNNSSRVIAVWNGFFKGGTAYTVRYAKKEQKEIFLLRPSDLSVTKIT